jgi:hypothetical protein
MRLEAGITQRLLGGPGQARLARALRRQRVTSGRWCRSHDSVASEPEKPDRQRASGRRRTHTSEREIRMACRQA